MTARIAVEGHAPLQPGACRVIAEAGANHNNSVERAIEMARAAAAAGAWAIKFQLYKADAISVPDSPKYWDDPFGTATQHEAFQVSDRLSYDAYGEIAAACRELGIAFFATPFDLDAVAALEAIDTPVYKIASGDITHRRLIEAVAATGRPVLLATGASTREEIHQAVDWSGLGPDRLCLLACTLTYPTPDEDGHFARIASFRREFDPYLIGFSDHTRGVAGAWMTTALGGVCIEKHYTLDQRLPDIPDHAFSVEPAQLAEMVDACERAAVLRGEEWIGVRDSERPARAGARRSLVLERDVAAGVPLTAGDLGVKRPGTGIAPAELERVIGATLRAARPRGTVLSADDLDGAAAG
ncbi:MAG: N-acetylneuraminate synthase family protein [Solirubrobacteraceae bacterium]|nr:N-acetylneuraminate synthase family protein [Solirubrobacteraceae bacterium]